VLKRLLTSYPGKWINLLVPALLVQLAISMSVSAQSQTPNSIKILQLDWTSQIVLSHIFGDLLQKKGYQVEFISKESDSQWFLLSSKQAHLQVEVWEGSMATRFDELVKRGLIQDAGTHAALTREEWWYPAYVEKVCPGLPDWQALNNCSHLFDQSPDGKAIYYTGPWEKPDRARIRALKLNYEVKQLDDSDSLRQQLESAIAQKKPIVIFNWTPNWVEAVHPGKFVEFPTYMAECEYDPGWGINPDLNWDCGNPKNGWLKKATAVNVATDWPCAFELINNISFNNDDIAKAAALVEVEGLSAEAAATYWLESNTSTWQAWINSSQCQVEMTSSKASN